MCHQHVVRHAFDVHLFPGNEPGDGGAKRSDCRESDCLTSEIVERSVPSKTPEDVGTNRERQQCDWEMYECGMHFL